jgi:hypothetical protein
VKARVIRPWQDPRTGIVVPPGETVDLPSSEAEAQLLQGYVQPIETATNERRERAVRPIERR